MKVYNEIDQQSSEWFDLRKNKVTGSKLPKLISCSSFQKSSGKVYNNTITEIAIGDWIQDDGGGISAQAIEEGHLGEGQAFQVYEKTLDPMDFNLTKPAFLESDCGRYGFSPDGVVNDDGFIEIKTIFNQGKFGQAIISEAQNLLIDDKYLMQVMMGFVVNPKFKYCDFIVYSMYMPSEYNLKIFRIERSDYEEKIQKVKEILESEILPEIELVKQNFKKQFNLK